MTSGDLGIILLTMDYLTHLAADSKRFAEALAGVDPSSPVPCCPEWDAADLAWHLTEVQWFWGTIVAERLREPEAADNAKPERPRTLGETVTLFNRSSERLQTALASTPDETPVWTWQDSDQSAGFIRRRQTHEALIHRVDAEQTVGFAPTVDSVLAVDGVDEMLEVMIAGIAPWASFEPDGVSVRIEATDADRHWGLAFGRMKGTSPFTGTTYDLDAATLGLDAPDATATIAGPAAALDLWLWGRGDVGDITVTGPIAVADRLRQAAVETTQ